MDLKSKKIVILGDRDGVPGPAMGSYSRSQIHFLFL